MGVSAREKYGISADRPARGSRVAEARVMTHVEHKLERRMQGAFVLVYGADGTVPSAAIYNIRNNDHHPWRVLARRYVEMRQKQAPIEQALKTVDELRDWIVQDLYGVR
jgi:hypothetical protein